MCIGIDCAMVVQESESITITTCITDELPNIIAWHKSLKQLDPRITYDGDCYRGILGQTPPPENKRI